MLPTHQLRALLIIAIPMMLSQAADTVMLFFDRFMLSYLGADHLAASMSGGVAEFAMASFFVGLISYVNAIVAQYFGKGDFVQCSLSAFQALLLSLISYPFLLMLVPLVKHFFVLMGAAQPELELSYSYFRFLMYGSIFVMLRNALAGFFLGLGKSRIVLVATTAGMVVNLPLNYLLIFGKLGFPKLGIVGAALGTVAGSFVIVIILLLVYFSDYYHRNYQTRDMLKFSFNHMSTLLHFGFPAGLELFLNMIAFNFIIQALHSYGRMVAAASTIVFNWDMVAFVPMLGLGMATTTVVGQAIGRGNRGEAEKNTYVALVTGWAYSLTIALLFVVMTGPLVSFFINSGEQDQIYSLGVIMLRMAAIYLVADSAQLVFSGALKGAGDSTWAMLISTGLHVCFAGVAVVLVYVLRVSPVVMWACFIVFLMLLGVSMFLRFKSGAWKHINMVK